MKSFTEQEIRQMRDFIYGPSTDNGWMACRENWLKPEAIQWLRTESEKIKAKAS
jgi:hypothetical protein